MPASKITKIFKITSPSTDIVFLGKTTGSIQSELADIKKKYKTHIKNPRKTEYLQVFDILECGNAEVTLIEKFACFSQTDLDNRYNRIYNRTKNVIDADDEFPEYEVEEDEYEPRMPSANDWKKPIKNIADATYQDRMTDFLRREKKILKETEDMMKKLKKLNKKVVQFLKEKAEYLSCSEYEL